MDRKWLAEWSRSHREKLLYNGKPFSQRRFAKHIGVSHKAIQSWEREQVDWVGEESIAAIAAHAQVPSSEIREKLYGSGEIELGSTSVKIEDILSALHELSARVSAQEKLMLEKLLQGQQNSNVSPPMNAASAAMQDALIASGIDWRYEGIISELYATLQSLPKTKRPAAIGLDCDRLRTIIFGGDAPNEKEWALIAALMKKVTNDSVWVSKYVENLAHAEMPSKPSQKLN